MKYEERIYRALINKDDLLSYNVKIEESDLLISSDINLADYAFKYLTKHRNYLESYILNNPKFRLSLLPLPQDDLAPPIVRDMLNKSRICGVGPMASVAGAISEFVGYDLLSHTKNLIIENGGDIFLQSKKTITVAVFAGESIFSYKVKFIVKPEKMPIGICTSSATVGHSLSFGKADAICVIAKSTTLADAAASSIGNKLLNKNAIKDILNYGMKIPGVQGIIIIFGKDMGVIGDLEFV